MSHPQFVLDGQGLYYMGPAGRSVWVATDVTPKQSADGQIVFKTAMSGTAITRITLVPKG